PEQVDPDRSIVAHGELDARNGFERVAYIALEILLRARALAALRELEIDPRVVAAIPGVAHGRHREQDLGKLLQHGFGLAHLLVGEFEAGADGRVKPQRDEALVDLRRELLADERQQAEAAQEYQQRGP